MGTKEILSETLCCGTELMGILKEDPNGVNLCACNRCGTILIDKNPQSEAKTYNIENISPVELKYVRDGDYGAWVCPACKTDGYLKDL
jgi:hypothetical protein